MTWLRIFSGIYFLINCGVFSFGQCPESSVILRSQEELQTFIDDYPNCKFLDQNLSIIESGITSLEGLSNLESVRNLSVSSNPNLESLEGLHNITECDRLTVGSNAMLEDLTGVRGLVWPDGITITNNPNLRTLAGLEGVLESPNFIFVQDNSRLIDISALGSLQKFEGLWLIGNDSVEYLPKLYNLEKFQQYTATTIIKDNPNLLSLVGLDSLKDFGRIDIVNNDRLKDLRGMQNLRMDQGIWLDISSNDSLVNLDGLQGLDSITESSTLEVHGNLYIRDNINLESLYGLDNLEYVDKDLLIEGNVKLGSLSGLSKLQYVGKSLVIDDTSLESLSGLDSLDAGGFAKLTVTNSPFLSDCAIKSMCDAIFLNADVTVGGNADGCDSVDEIEELCITSTHFKDQKMLVVFPNPVADILFIDGVLSVECKVSITDWTGRTISILGSQDQIDVSSLSSGMHTLNFQCGNDNFTSRFVKL